MTRKDDNILTFEEALAEEKEIIDASLYMMQIERYLPLFCRDQMLFLTFDELVLYPEDLLQRTQEFLGVEPIDLTAQGKVSANQWGDSLVWIRIRRLIANLQRVPGLSKSISIIPQNSRQYLKETVFQSKLITSLFKAGLKEKSKCLSPLTPKTRKRLLEQFEEPTRRLEEFLGWKLVSWHK